MSIYICLITPTGLPANVYFCRGVTYAIIGGVRYAVMSGRPTRVQVRRRYHVRQSIIFGTPMRAIISVKCDVSPGINKSKINLAFLTARSNSQDKSRPIGLVTFVINYVRFFQSSCLSR